MQGAVEWKSVAGALLQPTRVSRSLRSPTLSRPSSLESLRSRAPEIWRIYHTNALKHPKYIHVQAKESASLAVEGSTTGFGWLPSQPPAQNYR